jgi:hypothetical protein
VDISDELLWGRGVLMTSKARREFMEGYKREAVGLLEDIRLVHGRLSQRIPHDFRQRT